MNRHIINISDIDGFKIGSAQNENGGSGCTVIICEDGAVAGCDVRGGGPATRETDLLRPVNTVERIHAVMLSGGSAFGLDAASGAMQYLSEKNIGVTVGKWKVPIVCGASIFDFPVSDGIYKPDKSLGYKACVNSEKNIVREGNAGAGMGATVGKIAGPDRAMKSGLGVYAMQIGDIKTAAIVSVNALGDVVNIDNGKIMAGVLNQEKTGLGNSVDVLYSMVSGQVFTGNTTIGCLITNADLTKAQMNKAASMCHNGYARSIHPVHTSGDGDSIFTMSTAKIPANVDLVGVMGAECMARAIMSAVTHAESIKGFKAYKDL